MNPGFLNHPYPIIAVPQVPRSPCPGSRTGKPREVYCKPLIEGPKTSQERLNVRVSGSCQLNKRIHHIFGGAHIFGKHPFQYIHLPPADSSRDLLIPDRWRSPTNHTNLWLNNSQKGLRIAEHLSRCMCCENCKMVIFQPAMGSNKFWRLVWPTREDPN